MPKKKKAEDRYKQRKTGSVNFNIQRVSERNFKKLINPKGIDKD